MREIKFKCWDKKKLRMYTYGDGQTMRDEDSWLVDSITAVNYPLQRSDLVWLQYTGLKDKNGVEIYEGDIIDIEYHWDSSLIGKHVVKWDEDGFYQPLYPCGDWRVNQEYLEVIGNKFENPELLNNQK